MDKKEFSKKVIFTVIVLNILFTIAILYVFCRTGNEPTTLVASFFGFTTVEMWNLSKIKREKIRKNDMIQPEPEEDTDKY